MDIFRRPSTIARSHQRVSNLCSVQTKSANIAVQIIFTHFQRFTFSSQILINQSFRNYFLILFFSFFFFFYNFLDPYSLFSNSEHISFFYYIPLRRQRLHHDPRLLLGFFAFTNDRVSFLLLFAFLFIRIYQYIDCSLRPLHHLVILFPQSIGNQLVHTVPLENSSLISNREQFRIELIRLRCIIEEIRVSFFPTFTDDLTESQQLLHSHKVRRMNDQIFITHTPTISHNCYRYQYQTKKMQEQKNVLKEFQEPASFNEQSLSQSIIKESAIFKPEVTPQIADYIQTMEEESQAGISIMGMLQEAFATAAHPSQFQRTFQGSFSVFVVEKEDKNLCYITDGQHTILALSTRKKEEVSHHPLNKINNHFYIFQEKTHLYLNFTAQFQQPPPSQAHPYNPHYYFKDRYEDFVKLRETFTLSIPCEFLLLTKWEIVLVNISTSGYYAPALIIHEFKKGLSRNSPNYKSLNCILFQPTVQEKMEEYRLRDMREHFITRMPETRQTSLFYLARRMRLNAGRVENNSIVAVDRQKKILKFDNNKPYYIVLASDFLQGVCSISNVFREEMNSEEIQMIQSRHLNELFNGLNLSEEKKSILEKQRIQQERAILEKQQKRKESQLLWSDTSSSDEEGMQNETKQPEYNNSESEEEQDPLRALYKRQLNKQK